MAKKKHDPAPEPKPMPSEASPPEASPPESLEVFRILIADTEDVSHPRVAVVELTASSYEAACARVSQLTDPYNPNAPGVSLRPCRFEEVLPYLRRGFSIRRDAWPLTEVVLVHGHVSTRLDFYTRHPEYPSQRPQYLRECKLTDVDLMSEDWHVASKPPQMR